MVIDRSGCDDQPFSGIQYRLWHGLDGADARGQFAANSVFFRIGALAYNVGRLFMLKAQAGRWNRHQMQTLRWKLYETAGKIVFQCYM